MTFESASGHWSFMGTAQDAHSLHEPNFESGGNQICISKFTGNLFNSNMVMIPYNYMVSLILRPQSIFSILIGMNSPMGSMLLDPFLCWVSA